MRFFLLNILLLCQVLSNGQSLSTFRRSDNGDGTYTNPVIYSDYSDPDAIRVGDDYYMISSSFNHVPGLPILHSKDLVNWELIGHALKRLVPSAYYDSVRHGGGVWAPSIRYHNGEFYIYYPDPDFGIYLIKSKKITGPWTDPLLVQGGKGLIDPCPLWDDDGKVYLVHAYAGSRAGIKSILVVKELSSDGTKVINDAVMIYDGHGTDPTIEGPKFYKRNGYYYVFAPAGGVSTGWQTVLRSKNVYGPYERKVVLESGNSGINGPHQGAWVTTQTNQDWFLHFQDKKELGRVVHLQPMKWINDWPVIGVDGDADGKGNPVLHFKKPNVGKKYPPASPADADEFNANKIGLQWQWQANPKEGWAFPTGRGSLRMSANYFDEPNMWKAPFILGAKLPAPQFSMIIKFRFNPALMNDRFGLILFGKTYSMISITKKADGNYISVNYCNDAHRNTPDAVDQEVKFEGDEVYFNIYFSENQMAQYSYSPDGKYYFILGREYAATPGEWVGAKLGMFFTRKERTNDSGYADIDWVRFYYQKDLKTGGN